MHVRAASACCMTTCGVCRVLLEQPYVSACDVYIELKERGPSARIARAQEPRYFELGSSKMEMSGARARWRLSSACPRWLQRMGTRGRVVLGRAACSACITWTPFQPFLPHDKGSYALHSLVRSSRSLVGPREERGGVSFRTVQHLVPTIIEFCLALM